MKVGRLRMLIATSAIGAFAVASAATPLSPANDVHGRAQAPQHHQPGNDHQNPKAGELIRTVRQATSRFRDVTLAEAEGYQLAFGCVSGPDFGAMGLHYVNFPLVGDGELDPARPEIVIYEPLPNGGRKLTGADFLVLVDDWHAKNPAPPELGGQLLHLFESPNRFGLPAFYTLHVWAWKDNPVGTFSNWHSRVSCDSFSE